MQLPLNAKIDCDFELFHKILLAFFIIGLVVSGIQPLDYFTWTLEITPAIIGLLVLAFIFKRFKFSKMTYIFILLHCYILFVGGHYTYAEVPLFNWIRDVLGQTRNNYDKLGHFAQGFIPAIIVRELFIRKQIVKKGFWTELLTVCVCLSVSVIYELGEWAVALLTGKSSDAFLGTQGYVWDTQSDMFYALIGSLMMIIFMGPLQNKVLLELMDKQKLMQKNE